ncbi:dipeptidase [Daejeonella sp.]|uniref:dipeptidase n=1 Tax=Daejeonella sp. TaxID=2805397 RepID=UPI0039830F4F
MKNKRRDFLKISGLAGLTLASEGVFGGISSHSNNFDGSGLDPVLNADKIQQHQQRVNEQIKLDFEKARSILNPSQKQLDHGIELHKNSLVIDVYGFMPRASNDGALLSAAITSKASQLEIQDMQEDMSMSRFVIDKKERDEFQNAWKASGVTCVIQNAGEEGNDVKRLLKRLAHFTYTTDMMRDFVGKAVSPEDIIQAKKENRHALYFSGNGIPLPQDWISVEDELRYIRIFFQLGIRMMHLTYNRRNVIGDGCAELANGGLSDFGRSVVREMNRVGVIVDIAHSGWQTSLEAAQLSQRPMVASHSTVASVNHHIRSKPDNVIRAIADTGGYIGICCIPRFLGETGDIAAMMKHIDYVVKKFGSDHVAIGTDISYTSQFAREENRKIPSYPQGRTRWEALWPVDNFKESPEMVQSMSWTNWPLFTVGMVQMGYPDDVIQNILAGNALRVAKAVLAV